MKIKDHKDLSRGFDALARAGISLQDLAGLVREAESKGLLQLEDPLREKIKKWAIESGVLDEIQRQYSSSWSFSVTVRDGWSIQFVNRRKMNQLRKDSNAPTNHQR